MSLGQLPYVIRKRANLSRWYIYKFLSYVVQDSYVGSIAIFHNNAQFSVQILFLFIEHFLLSFSPFLPPPKIESSADCIENFGTRFECKIAQDLQYQTLSLHCKVHKIIVQEAPGQITSSFGWALSLLRLLHCLLFLPETCMGTLCHWEPM